MFDPAGFGRDLAAEVGRPQEERAEAYEWAFRKVLRFNPPDAEGRGRARIVSRSDVVLSFYSGMGNTPTVTLATRGATSIELSDGIREAVERGAPLPHYYAIDGTEDPGVFVCASEEQDSLELMHWAYAFLLACEAQGVRAEIASTEYVRATETFTWPAAGSAARPGGTYERVIKARRECSGRPMTTAPKNGRGSTGPAEAFPANEASKAHLRRLFPLLGVGVGTRMSRTGHADPALEVQGLGGLLQPRDHPSDVANRDVEKIE